MNFRQSIVRTIDEVRRQPVFSGMYIAGVALAIAFTMVFAILVNAGIAPIYPEYNRGTTIELKNVDIRNDRTNSSGKAMCGWKMVNEIIPQLKSYEVVTARRSIWGATPTVQLGAGRPDIRVAVANVDPAFFKVFPYRFLSGNPFSEAQHNAGIPVAVISDLLAERLYGSAEAALGKPVSVDFVNYTVTGVVKHASPLTVTSYADIFVPYTTSPGYDKPEFMSWIGSYQLTFKVRDKEAAAALRAEVSDAVRRINAADTTGWQIDIQRMPDTLHSALGRSTSDGNESGLQLFLPVILALVALLIIPTINLGCIIGGQMESRISELGIRRSFGATRYQLYCQVMLENLYMTLAGGFLGLLIAWIVVRTCASSVLGLLPGGMDETDLGVIEATPELLFTPVVFWGALLICLILNAVSAYFPVRVALHRSIVSSINVE